MIVDSSALIAILLSEPEEDRLKSILLAASGPSISAATLLETSIVFEARVGDNGAGELDELISDLRLAVVPFTAAQLHIARDAFRRFGKGRHPAQLNFGDCFAYALAKERGEPLLFKGEDFSRTDIQAVPY